MAGMRTMFEEEQRRFDGKFTKRGNLELASASLPLLRVRSVYDSQICLMIHAQASKTISAIQI